MAGQVRADVAPPVEIDADARRRHSPSGRHRGAALIVAEYGKMIGLYRRRQIDAKRGRPKYLVLQGKIGVNDRGRDIELVEDLSGERVKLRAGEVGGDL